ncbi:MAG: T9SS type A sorting domain-containing protein [Ignavibacteriales bacterium]|nr:T9SS type A sorting domain-containing protein [Ignavibacteriales bacterium]
MFFSSVTNKHWLLIQLFLITFLLSVSASAQDTLDNWASATSGTSNTLRTVSFFNADTGFAAGGGVIIHTTDGGKHWTMIDSVVVAGKMRKLFSVESHNSSRSNKTIAAGGPDTPTPCEGLLVGDLGEIFQTTDCGFTWAQISSPTFLNLRGITDDGANYNPDVVYACGDSGVVIKSTDGGKTWFTQITPTLSRLNTITFWNPDTGMAAGENGVIMRTTNGGTTWTLNPDTGLSGRMLSNIMMENHNSSTSNVRPSIAPGEGHLGNSDGTLLRTTDFGATFSLVSTGTSESINSIESGIGFNGSLIVGLTICGSGGTILTSPDGINWTKRNSHTTSDLYAVASAAMEDTSVPPNQVCVGAGGTSVVNEPPAFAVYPPDPGWCAGETHTISWSVNPLIANVSIEVRDVNAQTTAATISASTPNDGSFSWNIPPLFPAGSYEIFIHDVEWNGGWSYSLPFTIGSCDCRAPVLVDVKDVPNDQGGKVTVAWNQSCLDVPPNRVITYYSIWRGVNMSVSMKQLKLITPEMMSIDFSGKGYRSFSGTYWEWVGNMTAHYLEHYSYTASTPSDSSGAGNPYYKFFVSAQTADPFIFWDSNPDSGYSVDNIAPSALVNSPIIKSQTGSSVTLAWQNNPDNPDIMRYDIYRTTETSLMAKQTTEKIGETSDTSYTDNAMIPNKINVYTVIAVDIHGNESPASPPISVTPLSTTMQISYINRWNLVSVPMTMNNYDKSFIYPTAISSAFGYVSDYQSQTTLERGVGYWVKFSNAQDVSMTGGLTTDVTVTVHTGWNLIGSISSPVDVSKITSTQSNMITSQFFGYNGSYETVSTIEPGKGYWVKVNQSGTLTISSSLANISASNKIKIQPTSEMPPFSPAPDAEDLRPQTFGLSQNYPNPFNPVTVISYQLPADIYVMLKIYDVIGQEVATLVNGLQTAGYKSVTWDANNVPSGMYFYKLSAGDFLDMKKMVLLK